jgi:hypothetical protein
MTTSVEAVVHDALRSALRDIADKYGVIVESVDVEWVPVHPLGARSYHMPARLTIRSATFHPVTLEGAQKHEG